MVTGERKVEISVVWDNEVALEAMRELVSPDQVDDAGLYNMAVVGMYHLIHRATVNDCPHAKHVLEHIGFSKNAESFGRLRDVALRHARPLQ